MSFNLRGACPNPLKRTAESSSFEAPLPLPLAYQKIEDAATTILQGLCSSFESYPHIQFLLAGRSEDFNEAKLRYTKAMDLGHKRAIYRLGDLAEEEGNLEKVGELFTRASMEEMNLEGIREFTSSDPKEEIETYRKGALWDDVPCQVKLALLLLKENHEESQDEAIVWLISLALQNDKEALFRLGTFFKDGIRIDQDDQKARILFERAARLGHAEAENEVGHCYRLGIGVAQDRVQAFEWYKRAADQGLIIAADRVALCFLRGRGVAKDPQEAEKWYLFAAHKEYMPSQCALRRGYEDGSFGPANFSEALKWLIKAAQNGDIDSQIELAYHYKEGWTEEEQLILAQDLRRAFYWYNIAAAAGASEAQYWVANAYHRGRGVSRDPQLAMHYYFSSLNSGILLPHKVLDEWHQPVRLAREIKTLSLTAKMDISEAPEWQIVLNEANKWEKGWEDMEEFAIDANDVGHIFQDS